MSSSLKKNFGDLKKKVDQILDCLRPLSSAQSSRFEALSQADNDSTHDYVFPHEEGLESLHLQLRQPHAAGYTGQARQEMPVPRGCPTPVSVDLRIMEDKLNHISDKVDRLESRIFYRLTPKLSGIQDCVKQIMENVQKQLDKKLNHLNQKIETLDTNLCDHLKGQMAELRTQIEGTVDTLLQTPVQRTPENVLAEIKRSNQGVKTATEALIQEIRSSNFIVEQAIHRQTDCNMATATFHNHIDQSINEIIYQISRVKNDLLIFTEKECQLVIDRIEGPLPSHKTYILDFFVNYFKDSIKSGSSAYSLPWHITQFKSSVQGEVTFLTNGKLSVGMKYGRHPREVGLHPRHCGGLKVNATVTDTTGQLPDLLVGEVRWDVSEEDITNNTMLGVNVGEVDCLDIVSGGYADISDYDHKAILVRYVVEVL